jgi:hypothetical protein
LGKFKLAIRRKIDNADIWDTQTGKLDKMGVIMMTAMINLCIIFPIIWLAGMMAMIFIFRIGFLPWQIVMEEIIDSFGLGTGFQASVLRYGSHMLLCGSVVIENFRAFNLILIFQVMPIQLYLECIKLMKDFQIRENALRNSDKFRKLFLAYDQLRLLNQEAQRYTGIQISFLLLIGTVLSVLANFGTLRGYHIFPWYLYPVLPTLSIIILLILKLLLPFAINVHENSEEMLMQWKSDSNHAKSKYLRRKLKSIRSLRWYAGLMGFYECNFFILENSFRIAFYVVILDYTINMIMAIPASALAGFKFGM